jgi:hypothetical protein
MGASRKSKTARAAIVPPTRSPRIGVDPESHRKEQPSWQVGSLDLGAPWTFMSLSEADWWSDVFPKLKSFETMTWQEILSQVGDPTYGTNSHLVSVDKLVPEARRRLADLRMWDDLEELLSLRLTARCRVWGILVGHTLRLLWYDPNHEVCPNLR